jgi:hypothetical protein
MASIKHGSILLRAKESRLSAEGVSSMAGAEVTVVNSSKQGAIARRNIKPPLNPRPTDFQISHHAHGENHIAGEKSFCLKPGPEQLVAPEAAIQGG